MCQRLYFGPTSWSGRSVYSKQMTSSFPLARFCIRLPKDISPSRIPSCCQSSRVSYVSKHRSVQWQFGLPENQTLLSFIGPECPSSTDSPDSRPQFVDLTMRLLKLFDFLLKLNSVPFSECSGFFECSIPIFQLANQGGDVHPP
jgi:hypothetical protein